MVQVKTQIGFITYAVRPLWSNFVTLFPCAHFVLTNLLENLKAYEQVCCWHACSPALFSLSACERCRTACPSVQCRR